MGGRFERHKMTDRRDAIKNKISRNKYDCKFASLDDDKRIEVLKSSAAFIACLISDIGGDSIADVSDMIDTQSKGLRSMPFDEITHYYDRYFITNTVLEILMDRLIKKEAQNE